MKSTPVTTSVLIAAIACMLGCDTESKREQIAPAAPDMMVADPNAMPVACAIGAHPCACPDGMESGIQLCFESGLQECQCTDPAPVVMEMPVAPGGGVVPDVLCAELEGQAGCDARSHASDVLPASILFVLDRSGSMACNPPPTQTVEECNEMPGAKNPTAPTRWTITVEAMKSAFSALEGTNAKAGLELFSIDNACGVTSTPSVGVQEVNGPLLDTLGRALDAFDPRGGTPIVGATVLAYSHLHEEIKAPGNRYVVLITDGEESCGFGEGTEEDLADARKHLLEVEILKAREANIRTFVIGSPGSEGARGFLSEIAYLGGTARNTTCTHGDPDADEGDCHYDLTKDEDFAESLADALGEIGGQTLGCELETPASQTGELNVQITSASGDADGGVGDAGAGVPTCIVHDESPCADSDGWQYAKDVNGLEDRSRVVLCGAACEQVKSDPSTRVDVILGCPVVE